MCGIVGVITKESMGMSMPQIDWFQDALVSDSVRGFDATGIVAVDPYKSLDVAKVASHPFHLLQHPDWAKFRNKAWNSKVLIGHNRKATSGSKDNPEHAHPFVSEDNRIVLVHNGFVENARILDPQISVDSKIICDLLALHKGDAVKVASLINGAFALVWYDTKDHTVNFLRNKERPLSVSDGNNGIFFASEPRMLQWLAERQAHTSVKLGKVEYFDENKWCRFHMKPMKWSEPKEVKWKPDKAITNYASTSAWNGQQAVNDWTGWEHSFVPSVLEGDLATGSPNPVTGEEFTVVGPATLTKTPLQNGLDLAQLAAVAALERYQPNRTGGTLVSPRPAWESDMELMDELRDWLIEEGRLDAVPNRVESVPRENTYTTFFVILWSEKIPPKFNSLKPWKLRGKMRFGSLEDAYLWRNKKLVNLMVTEETSIGWNEKILMMEANGIEEKATNVYLRTYNKVLFTPTDWATFITKNFHCAQCGTTVKSADLKYITVHHHPATSTVICPKCNLERFLQQPDEVKESMLQHNAVDPRQWKAS